MTWSHVSPINASVAIRSWRTGVRRALVTSFHRPQGVEGDEHGKAQRLEAWIAAQADIQKCACNRSGRSAWSRCQSCWANSGM